MSDSNKNINAELIMTRLDDLKESQEKIVTEMSNNFKEINTTLSDFKTTIKEVKEIKDWKKEVLDVWSPVNMKEAEKEVYIQKGKWSIVYGVIVAINVVWIVFVAALKLLK